MARKTYFVFLGLIAIISILTLQSGRYLSSSNEQRITFSDRIDEQRQFDRIGQPSVWQEKYEETDIPTRLTPVPKMVLKVKSTKTSSKLLYETEEKDSYSFPLYAVLPTAGCSNFTNQKDTAGSDRKQIIGEIASTVKTSILFEFSPLVDDHVRKMFASNVLGESWFEVHPFQVSCLPISDGDLFCALRIWLRMDRFHGGKDMSSVRNRFQDSFTYVMKLDANLKYIPGSGELLGIPTPVQDVAFTGPEDPRIFAINGSIFVNFIMAHSYDNVNFPLRRQFAWNVDNSVLYDIQVHRFVLNEWEKNWTPWVVNDTLHFVYQFTPVMRIMRCRIQDPKLTRSIDCSFIAGQPQYGSVSSTSTMLLRGGSPFVKYKGNYHLAVTHSVQAFANSRLYGAQLVLINGISMQIVLVSSPIFIDLKTMRRIENLAGSMIKLPFVYARSVIVENEDSLIVALGVNDNMSFLIRVQGVAALLNEAIDRDEQLLAIDSSCILQETEQQKEKRMSQIYSQMNEWLRNKNIEEIGSRFATGPPPPQQPSFTHSQ